MIYAFGPYELDTRVYELRERGQRRPVEPQVFDVLAYLIAHRDRVIAKEELLDQLWPDRVVSETTLTSRLKAARKAVGDTGKAQLVIRTQHGRGYRFIADVEERDAAVVMPAPEARRTDAGIVGRGEELVQLERALAAALEAHRRFVFIEGEAGAGKTTLVEAFVRGLSGVRVARGQCVEHRGSGEPYMPLLDAIGRLCRGADAARIIELLSRDAPSWLVQLPWLLSDADVAALTARAPSGDRMLRELAMFVERASCETPLVLVIEDLHWCDSATLEALDLLARHTDPARLLVIGTLRPTKCAVAAMAQELRARAQCEVIHLPLFAQRELEALLRMRFANADFAGDLASILHARTSGNALFAGNLIDWWVARGLIREHDGAWHLDAALPALETGVPDSLQHLLEKQIAELAPEQQRMLETASVIGREFPVALVAATCAVDDDALEQQCESFAREGRFLQPSGTEQWGDGTLTARFAFTHDLFVDVLYGRIPDARRARLHQQAGLALERAWQGRERERGAEMALHFQRAHDRERALRHLDLAADQAARRSAYREVVLHLTSMLALLEDDRARELSVRARLAPALTATRGWADAEAERNYKRAIELARGAGDRALLSQLLYGIAVMYEYRGEYRKAEEIAKERLALDGSGQHANAVESHELLACSMMHQGRYGETLEHGACALAAADADPRSDPARALLLVQTHGWLSGALVFAGRGEEALQHSREALRIADACADEWSKATAYAQAAFVRFYRREVEACARLAGTAAAIARDRRLPFHLGCARILEGWVASNAGRHDEAIREVRAGLRTTMALGARLDAPLFLAILAECLERKGERERALESLDDALALVNRNRSFFYLPEIYRMTAELLADGDRDAAVSALQRALHIAEEQQAPFFLLKVTATLAAIGAAPSPLSSRG